MIGLASWAQLHIKRVRSVTVLVRPVVMQKMLSISKPHLQVSKVAHTGIIMLTETPGKQGRADSATPRALTCAGRAHAPSFLHACLAPVLKRVLVYMETFKTGSSSYCCIC